MEPERFPATQPIERVPEPVYDPEPPVRHGRARTAGAAGLVISLLAALALAGYLLATTHAWQTRASDLDDVSHQLGAELGAAQQDLAAKQTDLDSVNAQLDAAQERITELADEKAQIGDDREAQRKLVDYQERVTSAAADVAAALDRCIQGQQQYIVYLKDSASYDPAALEQYGSDVAGFCQTATDANSKLQEELRK